MFSATGMTLISTFAKAQRGLNRLDQSRAIFLSDRDAILNDLHTRAESFRFLDSGRPRARLSPSIQTRKYPCCWRKSKNFRGSVPEGTATQNVIRMVAAARFVIPSGAQRSRGSAELPIGFAADSRLRSK